MQKTDIKNYVEIVKELTGILRGFGYDCNDYQTDVYFYYDEKEKIARLETFINAGGRARLNDDHYTIYIDHPKNRSYSAGIWDYYCDIDELLEYAEIPEEDKEQFLSEVRDYAGVDPDDELDYHDVTSYLESGKCEEYLEKLSTFYREAVDENSNFEGEAEEIIDKFIRDFDRDSDFEQKDAALS